MNTVPTWIAGPIAIALIVGLGVFIYPWLLTRRYGTLSVAVATVALTALYYAFESNSASTGSRLAFGFLWAIAPVIAGVIIKRLQSTDAKSS